MPYSLPGDRMPEAEVSLRLAFHLLGLPASLGVARVLIDGAQDREPFVHCHGPWITTATV